MKKIFTSVMAAMLTIATCLSGVFALTKDESYQAAREYYGKKTVLQGADEVIAYESLGLQSDDLKIENVVNTDFASNVAKTVIALTLHGNDPRNYEGVNYVEMLESYVHENGAVDKEKDSTDANYQYICVNALYIVNSDKTELAADYLASLIQDNGSFIAWGFEDIATTSWIIETLSLVNKAKYQPVIEKIISYIQSKQTETAGYDGYGYGVDPCTQASVLLGLLAYDEAGIKGTTYNQGENNPYDVLLSFQNDNGSFWQFEQGEEDAFATPQACLTIGTYYNGSVYMTAYNSYQELNKPEEKPVVEDKKDVVDTSDLTVGLGYMSLLVMSAYVVMRGRRYVE